MEDRTRAETEAIIKVRINIKNGLHNMGRKECMFGAGYNLVCKDIN